MISFINKQLDKNNFKVWLYTPGSSFLGELIVDNPVLTLQLEGLVSTFDFTIPENIDVVEDGDLNNIVNPRLNEALDQFQVEVWYGDLAAENYQKQRFIIVDTPNSFGNDITRFSYRAYSREYENKFVRLVNWPGVLIEEYIQKRVFNISNDIDQQITVNLDYKLKNERLIRAELVKDFVYRLVNQTVSATPYQFSIQPKESSLKIFKSASGSFVLLVKNVDYNIIKDSYTGIISIEYITTGNPNLSIGDTTYVEYKLEEPPTFGLIRNEDLTLSSEFDFYYTAPVNPALNGSVTFFVPTIPKVFSKTSVLSYDSEIPADSQIQVKFYYEPILSASQTLPEADIFQNVTKDALTIQQVMNNILQYGDEDDSSAKWSAFYSAQLGNELRSGFAFNNATLLTAINETLKAFDAIAVPDTINKRFYIYQKDSPDTFVQNNIVVSSYRQPTGLSIEYGKYLRDVQQTISSESIVTIIRGIGKDNLTADSATPTGYNEWEDYTYYLDGATITNWETILANPNTGLTPTLSRSSRWMSDDLTRKLLLWQFARASIEDVLYNTIPIAQQNRLGGYTDKGIVIAQDEIVERIVTNESKIVPLRVELSKSNTLLTTLEISENVEHLATWTGAFEGVSYSGIAGYANYINAKKNKVLSEITQIEAALNQLQSDFDFINGLLAQFYVAIEKDKFTALFNNPDLTSYNFTQANLQELNGFRREGLYENKFITKASTLFVEMKNEINSLKQPRVEVSANVIGILQASEARAEWNNLVLGGLANLIVDRLNIDRQIQIKTLTISPDANSTNINFSTEKNYIGIGQKYLGRFFSNAAYNLKNNLGYNEGFWNRGSEDGEDAANKLTQGFLIGGNNPLTTQTVIISDEGITTDGHTVNPIDDSVVSASSDIGRMLLFGFVKINAGRIDVFNRNVQGQVVNSVVVSPTGVLHTTGNLQTSMTSNGFLIKHNTNTKFSVDTSGNAIFAGQLSAATGTFAGELSAATGTFSGGISSTSGFIGGWQITSTGLLKSPDVLISALGFIDFSGTGFNPQGALVSPKLRIDGRAVGAQKIIDTLSGKFSVTADGILTATDGNFSGQVTINKPSFSSTNAGVFLGFDSGIAKLNIGDATNSLQWNGLDLLIGNFKISNTSDTFGVGSETPASGYLLAKFLNNSLYLDQNRILLTDSTSSSGIAGRQLRLLKDQVELATWAEFGPNTGIRITALGLEDLAGTGFVNIKKGANSRQIPGAQIVGTTLTIYLE